MKAEGDFGIMLGPLCGGLEGRTGLNSWGAQQAGCRLILAPWGAYALYMREISIHEVLQNKKEIVQETSSFYPSPRRRVAIHVLMGVVLPPAGKKRSLPAQKREPALAPSKVSPRGSTEGKPAPQNKISFSFFFSPLLLPLFSLPPLFSRQGLTM